MFHHRETKFDKRNKYNRRAGYRRLINELKSWEYAQRDKYFIIHTPFSNMKLINDLKMKWELKYEYIGNKEKGQILVQTTRYTNMNIYIDVKQYRNEKTTIL